jgi:DNA-binding transcriptional LysR family regulator
VPALHLRGGVRPVYLLILGLAPLDDHDLLSGAATVKLNDRIGAIGDMNFSAVDLNLLRVFDAMMVELNTTRTGERVGLSQPAVSSALGRLRHITGDALFVRDGNRMVPTTRACELSQPIRAALQQLEQALAGVARFDPASATGTFRIVGSDYFSSLLMPPLARIVRERAPGLTLQMLDRPSTAVVQLLSDGDARMEVPEWICRRSLFRSFIVTVARRGDPVLAAAGVRPGQRIPPATFCAMPQVLMSMDGGQAGTMDAVLAARGLARHLAFTVPHFHAVALAVAEAGL